MNAGAFKLRNLIVCALMILLAFKLNESKVVLIEEVLVTMTTEAPTQAAFGKLLTPDDVIRVVPGITKGNLAQMRYAGTGPKFLKPTPRTVLYRESDISAWLEGSERTSTAEAG